MFPNIDLLYFFGPAVILATLFLLAFKYRQNKRNFSDFRKAVEYFKMTSLLFGVLIAILLMSLPATPALKSFGYPKDIFTVKDENKVLHLLQEYNRAIVRTTEVLRWFLFLFTWWFLTTLFFVVKAYKDENSTFSQQSA